MYQTIPELVEDYFMVVDAKKIEEALKSSPDKVTVEEILFIDQTDIIPQVNENRWEYFCELRHKGKSYSVHSPVG